ncbi:GNAT family N-acetyltransferase [Sphingomonas sp.]|uniref:GNAT family N-acetyltransferase n=1 Tax=Sphingomonas sp. TaxID=28214 RepID=UPI0035BC682E
MPASFAVDAPLRFQVGARTLAAIPRRMVRVAWSLDDVLSGTTRSLPPLGDADGYLLTSMPEALVATLRADGFVARVRHRYVRHYTDLTIGHEAWLAALSANARSAVRRKTKRLADGKALDVRAYRTPAELADFYALARPLSALTYQERLLDAGLPEDVAVLDTLAAQDSVRAWLLFHDGAPIAYLCCTADGSTLRYDHVGHDPAFAHASPGTVLHAEAMRQLFDDRFTRFDFTEGEGQHKRQFATAGAACADVILLRPTLANRAALAALAGLDRAVAVTKRLAGSGRAKRLADRIRRA